jgi:HEAT repeat protein
MALWRRANVNRLKERGDAVGLVEALRDERRRDEAEDALVELGPGALEAIKGGEHHQNVSVRVACRKLAEQITENEERGAAKRLNALKRTNSTAEIAGYLSDAIAGVRERAARVLGSIGDESQLGLLSLAARRDPEPRVRVAAVNAIAVIGSPRTFDVLVELLAKETDTDVVGKMIGALARSGHPRAGHAIVDAYRRRGEVQYEAERALKAIGQLALEPTLRLLDDDSAHHRQSAARVLGSIGDPRAVEPLIGAIKRALTRLEPIQEEMQQHSRKVAVAAAQGVPQFWADGFFESLGPSIAADEEQSARREAAKALGSLDRRAVASLVSALVEAEQNPTIVKIVARALERIGGVEAEAALQRHRSGRRR